MRAARLLLELDRCAASRPRAGSRPAALGGADRAQARAAARAAPARRAAPGTSPTRAGCRRGPPGSTLELRRRSRRACALRRRPPPLPGEPVAQLVVAVGRVEDPRARRAAARPCRSSGSPGAGRRRRSAPAGGSGRAARPGRTRSRRRRRGRSRCTRKRRCLPVARPSPARRARSRRRAASRRDCRARTARAARSSAQRSSVSSRRAERRRRRRSSARSSSSASEPVGLRGERVGERARRLGQDREPGGGAVAAEALEVLRQARERAVQVERGDRPAGALPVRPSPAMQHDRPVEALDEARGDDPDHALVPVLARRRRSRAGGASPRATPRPARSPRAGSVSSTAWRSRFSSSSSLGERARLVRVVGEQQLERRARDGRAGRRR